MNVNTESRRKRNDNTPVRASPTSNTKKAESTPVQPGNLTLNDIAALLDQKLSPSSLPMQNLRAAWKEDVKSMITQEINSALNVIKEDFTATTDFITEHVRNLQSQVKDKDRVIKTLENEQSKLQKEFSELSSRLTSLESISRGCNIEIQAVPEKNGENLMSSLFKMCEIMNVPLLDSDLRACWRVAKMDPTSSRPRNIIVTVASPSLRDSILSAYTRYNKEHRDNRLNSTHIGIEGESRMIYLSEHLSREAKQLHYSARMFAKENDYKFVWIKYGQIYLRKDINADAIRVKNKDFLKKISQ